MNIKNQTIPSAINAQEYGHLPFANEPYKADNSTNYQGGISNPSLSHIIQRLGAEKGALSHPALSINRVMPRKPNMSGVDIAISKADFGDNLFGQIMKPQRNKNE